MSVTARAAIVGCIVALISVFVTALVAIPLAVSATERSNREALGTQANAIAAVLKARAAKRVPDTLPLLEQLRRDDIGLFVISEGHTNTPGLPEAIVRQIVDGKRVSLRAVPVNGKLSLVEGRPLDNGEGIVLTRPANTGLGRQVLLSLWLPLLAGLGAGVLAGVLLGRRLARPIRNAAVAAARLSSGDRGVRLRVEPPAEVGRLAVSINELAEALATSEGRQREFLMSVSHELRTPLTTIRGYAEALSDGVVHSESAEGVGKTITAEAERLDRLVSDLLSLARLEADDFAIEPANVELGELIQSAEAAFAGRCAQLGVRLRLERAGGPILVRTDPVRLRQIIDGLMENALRVVQPGRPIVLAIGADPGRAIVEVRDGGPGLTDDDLKVAFQKRALHARYQGERKVGSGLGLALAAGLARRLGGHIEAGHAPEGGARFTVYLPRTIDSPAISGFAAPSGA
jgi:two-component system sensor histidine kinase BaeS